MVPYQEKKTADVSLQAFCTSLSVAGDCGTWEFWVWDTVKVFPGLGKRILGRFSSLSFSTKMWGYNQKWPMCLLAGKEGPSFLITPKSFSQMNRVHKN